MVSSRLEHISCHKGAESFFIRNWRDAGDAPFILVQEPGLGKRFTLLVTVPSLQVVDDRDVVYVLSISTQELMPVEFIFAQTSLLQVSVERFPAVNGRPRCRSLSVAIEETVLLFIFMIFTLFIDSKVVCHALDT